MIVVAAAVVAFVNVNVIPMDRERVENAQTVIVRDDRIVAIGPVRDVSVPADATVIDGTGRYLVPGLTDAHAHLNDLPFAHARPDFGDAPLYLAYGITTVFNLSGTPTHLEWKRRIEAGELVGPTIYTSGSFVNEPRVNTPDDVRRDIVSQVRDGYDLIKFHELPGTTTGLSLPAYLTMIETARDQNVPLVGHAPVNLGWDVLLQARQPLAHVGNLSNIYFLPMVGNREFLILPVAALLVLAVMTAARGAAWIIGRRRTTVRQRLPTLSRVRAFTAGILLVALVSVVCAVLFLPGGPLFESATLRVVFTLLVLLMATAAVSVVVLTARIWRDASASMRARLEASLVSIASVALASTLAIFWVPISWRSTDSGIDRAARQIHEAGIPVQTTLVVYESMSTPARAAFIQDPAIAYLRADTRDQWRRLPHAGTPGFGYHRFMKKVTGALHRAGVTLIAGTDAMGIPPIPPGTSLHRELKLLTESGLTPYEAIRAATVNPAVFLRKDNEFGTIAVGKRADVLLVEGNPLQDIGRLKQPIGVMVRGNWLARDRLQQMLNALLSKG